MTVLDAQDPAPPEGGEWAEPAPRTLWHRRCATLAEHPGRWARFGPYGAGASKQAKAIREGRYGPGFEAMVRNYFVWARFVGTDADVVTLPQQTSTVTA